MKSKSLIKVGISVAMLALVLRVVNFHDLGHTIRDIPPGIALLMAIVYGAGQLLSAFKWWNIAKAGGIQISFRQTLQAYFIGMYVNCFGLGMVGGDVTRGILIGRGQAATFGGISSVIADRLHGLAVLASIGFISILCVGMHTLEPWLIYLLLAVAGSVLVGWLVGPWLLLKLVPPSNHLREKAEQVSKAFPKSPRVVALITGTSVIFHISQIALHMLMAQAVGASVSWSLLFITIPFVNILSSLPISWNGLGVRENSYVFFLVPAILTKTQTVAWGAMWLLAVMISSAIGGMIALMTGDLALVKKKSEEIEAAG